MWNFIGQQHGGVEDIGLINTWTAPIRPVTNMDISDTAQSWRDTSYNYFVDFETFVLVQLHRFGGDTRAGHASGIDWFTNNVPKNRPLVVVQHYNMESAETVTSDPITGWSIAERDALLAMLSGYNVIALLVGHDHNTPTQLRVEIPVPGTNITFDQFRPGIASFDDREPNSHFALLRVSGTDLNVASGRIDNNDGSIIWEFGYSKALPKVGQEAPQPVCNCELSPECCSLEPGLPNGGGLGGGGLGGGGIGGLSGGGRG
jgi:cytolysin (calcineurin-like family phosphatase)